jgi:hypothetical protein
METGRRSAVPLPRSGYRSVGEILGLGLHALATDDRSRAAAFLEEFRTRGDGAPPEWRVATLVLEAAIDGGAGAVEPLERAIALQSELPRPNETPEVAKPPEELLGEILLGQGRAAEARDAFIAADARWPSRLATSLGVARAYVALGDAAAARAAYAALRAQLDQAPPDHPARREAERYLASH